MTVLEQRAQLQTYGDAIGIGPSAARVLDRYNVLDDVNRRCGERGSILQKMCLRRWRDGDVMFEQDFTAEKEAFGYGYASQI